MEEEVEEWKKTTIMETSPQHRPYRMETSPQHRPYSPTFNREHKTPFTSSTMSALVDV
jgi:hypothetical protein